MNTNEWQQRFAWLEQEQRKDRAQLVALQERAVHLEGQIHALRDQMQIVLDEAGNWANLQARLQMLEETIQRTRQELAQRQETFQTQMQDQIRALQTEARTTLARLTEEVAALKEGLKAWEATKQRLHALSEEDQNLHRRLDQIAGDLNDLQRRFDERLQLIRLLQEAQERNARALLEQQNTLTAFRKRMEELAASLKVFGENLQKMDLRLQDVAAKEDERRRQQAAFLEESQRLQAEQERQWKVWEARFQSVEALAQRLEAQILSMEAFRQELNRARDRLESLIERMERRVHEIAEMQRLAEERFRQEWMTFRADEQKRWTAFQLTYEEQLHDLQRRLDEHREQLEAHKDLLARLQDGLNMVLEHLQKQLDTLFRMTQSWLEEYERQRKALTP